MISLALHRKTDYSTPLMMQVAARLAVAVPAAVVAMNCGGWGAVPAALLALPGRSDA